MNRVKTAGFSLSASSPDGNDGPYLEWHQLDHMPEQYQMPGLLQGQRWVSTPECRAARTVQSDRFVAANHIVHYLFGEPVAQTIDDWFTLGGHLAEVGRFPHRLPAVLLTAVDLVATYAAPSALVTPAVVPFRPNRGIYLVVELPERLGEAAPWDPEQVERLMAVDGVAGMWTFAPSGFRPDRLDTTGYGITVCYLDGDPVEVARPVAEVFADRWAHVPATPALAAPFVSMRPWEWDRYGNPG